MWSLPSGTWPTSKLKGGTPARSSGFTWACEDWRDVLHQFTSNQLGDDHIWVFIGSAYSSPPFILLSNRKESGIIWGLDLCTLYLTMTTTVTTISWVVRTNSGLFINVTKSCVVNLIMELQSLSCLQLFCCKTDKALFITGPMKTGRIISALTVMS